jgi:hypothetical protein
MGWNPCVLEIKMINRKSGSFGKTWNSNMFIMMDIPIYLLSLDSHYGIDDPYLICNMCYMESYTMAHIKSYKSGIYCRANGNMMKCACLFCKINVHLLLKFWAGKWDSETGCVVVVCHCDGTFLCRFHWLGLEFAMGKTLATIESFRLTLGITTLT